MELLDGGCQVVREDVVSTFLRGVIQYYDYYLVYLNQTTVDLCFPCNHAPTVSTSGKKRSVALVKMFTVTCDFYDPFHFTEEFTYTHKGSQSGR